MHHTGLTHKHIHWPIHTFGHQNVSGSPCLFSCAAPRGPGGKPTQTGGTRNLLPLRQLRTTKTFYPTFKLISDRSKRDVMYGPSKSSCLMCSVSYLHRIKKLCSLRKYKHWIVHAQIVLNYYMTLNVMYACSTNDNVNGWTLLIRMLV